MLICCDDPFPRTFRRLEKGHRLIFFADKGTTIDSFLRQNSREKFVYDALHAHVYSGTYDVLRGPLGRTQQYDSMNLLHQGYGTTSAGSLAPEGLVEALTFLLTRGCCYLGVYATNGPAKSSVKFLHNQKSCVFRRTLDGDAQQVRGGFSLQDLVASAVF